MNHELLPKIGQRLVPKQCIWHWVFVCMEVLLGGDCAESRKAWQAPFKEWTYHAVRKGAPGVIAQAMKLDPTHPKLRDIPARFAPSDASLDPSKTVSDAKPKKKRKRDGKDTDEEDEADSRRRRALLEKLAREKRERAARADAKAREAKAMKAKKSKKARRKRGREAAEEARRRAALDAARKGSGRPREEGGATGSGP